MEEFDHSGNPEVKSVRKAVYDDILSYITQNNITPGSKLPSELELAEMMNVSRTSLREGIRMLEGAGFITTKHGGGMYVAEYDGTPLLDYVQYSIGYGNNGLAELYDLRKCMEIHYIREATEKITSDQLQRLKVIVEKMQANDNKEVSDLLEYHWHDMDFHLILYENISNQLVAHMLQLYWDVMLTRHLPSRMHDLPGTIVGNHEMILRALESGNPNFAQSAMKVHMFDSHII